VWHWDKDTIEMQGEMGMPISMAFSPRGDVLAVGVDESTLYLLDPSKSGIEAILGEFYFSSSFDDDGTFVEGVAFTPDGHYLIVSESSSEDGTTIDVWGIRP
jgi:WD40 repeat protein